MHIMEPAIQIPQLPLVRHVLVNLHLPIQIVLHEPRDLRAALDTTERGPAPDAAGDELEGARGDFLPGGGDADDGGDAPALVARLEGGAHDVDVAGAVDWGWVRWDGVRIGVEG